jgi:hypothetical protein
MTPDVKNGPHLRPPTREERQLAMLWIAAVASSLILRPFWIALAPHLRPCTLRTMTGVPCPTCGTTRSALAMLDGDLLTAFLVNPLATLAGSVFVVGGLAAVVWLILRLPIVSLGLKWNRWWTMAVVGVVAVNWVYLIATH